MGRGQYQWNTPLAQLTTTGTVQFANFGSGSLQTDANGNVTVSSDENLKNIQGTFVTGLDAILAIQPINYTWKDTTGYDTQNTYTGFSAQNVQQAIPEAVAIDKNGYLTLQDRPILAALVNAVKDMNELVKTLTTRVDTIFTWFNGNSFQVQGSVCVDDVCVTKEQFKNMLLQQGGYTQPTPSPAPTPVPEEPQDEPIVETEEPVVEPVPEPEPPVEEEVIPPPVDEIIPEA